ncbi:oligosaccharide flippase family protein [bacterium]|nr:oligosaccharide flippase family protein [bacterium]
MQMTFGRLLGGTAVTSTARVGEYGLSFIRNVMLARVLAKADYGLAALFGLTVTLFEVAGRMAFGQQIVQSRHGDTDEFMSSAHLFQFVAGIGGAVLVVVGSVPIARLLGVPELWWAFALLAVVSVSHGLIHLESSRQQRELNFVPGAAVILIPQLVVTIITWPMAVWIGDFQVILWIMSLKAVLATLVSHVVAKRAYRWRCDEAYFRSMFSFSWPLFLNGFLLLACCQGDQFLVAAKLSMSDLAVYALAFMLAGVPRLIFAQVGQSIMLPVLARCQDDLERMRYLTRTCLEAAAAAAVAFLVPLVIAGEHFVVLFFGERYAGSGMLVAVLGFATAIRFLRVAPTTAALSRGDTMLSLHANLIRSTSLPLAVVSLWLDAGLLWIAGCAVAGEILAVGYTFKRLCRQGMLYTSEFLGASGYVALFILTACGLVYSGANNWDFWWVVTATIAVILVAIVTAPLFLPKIAGILTLKCHP